MLQDRRKTPRRAFKRIARFNNDLTGRANASSSTCPTRATPPAFTLTISGDKGDERRACRVVWRLGHEVGVQFTDALPAPR